MFHWLQHYLTAQPTLVPVIMIVIVILLGLVGQVIANRTGIPNIILLLIGGVALGPSGLGLIRPDIFGSGLLPIVALCVALIVFESARGIDLRHLTRTSRPVIMLVTVGILVTTLCASLLAWWLVGLPLRVALLFGAIVSVTGPTVIQPIITQLALAPKYRAVLEGESLFADAIGVMLAASIFSYITAQQNPLFKLLPGLGHLALSLAVGAAVGAILSLCSWALLRRLAPMPAPLVRLSVIATALSVYVVSEMLAHETGIFAVAVAGVLFGTLPLPYSDTLRQLERDLRILALSLVFLLLAANVPLAGLFHLGLRGIALVVLLMVAVRPLAVGLATWGSDLNLREKAFLALLGPRGIVAASAGTLFEFELLSRGIPGARDFGELVFLVILVTVLIEGAGAPWLASRLRIIPPKIFLLGGDKQARRLAESLVAEGESVQLVDEEMDNVHALLARELPAQMCALDDREALEKCGLHEAKQAVIATTDDERNLALAKQIHAWFPKVPLYARLNDEANRGRFTEADLCIWPQTEEKPSPLPLSIWNAAVQPETAVEVEVQNPSLLGQPLSQIELPTGCILIVLERRGRTMVPRGGTVLQVGDRVTIVGEAIAVERARRLLGSQPRRPRSFRAGLPFMRPRP
ncbi:MAG TPA: cation:proton antiporter [Oscillatoriaceae cyanobacterium]